MIQSRVGSMLEYIWYVLLRGNLHYLYQLYLFNS